jgi:hypothetical protein
MTVMYNSKTNESMRDILDQLEHIMYGYNYQVTFGIDIFENCTNLDEFKINLKKRFPYSRPENANLILYNVEDFWNEINFGLNYRGDSAAGLRLDEKENEKLEKLQLSYKDFLRQFINENTKIFSYPDEEGIPGYPVYWDYRFVVQTDNDKCIFIYGSSSD